MRTSGRRVAVGLAGVLLLVLGLLAGTGGAPADAQAAGPPAVVFIAEAVVSPTVLRVVTEVVPGGAVTTVFVLYGQSAAYGSSSARRSLPSGATPVRVTWQLTGLHRSTTYHVQVVAVSSLGRSAPPGATVPLPATSPSPPPSSVLPPTAPSTPAGGADQVRALPVSAGGAAFSSLNDVSCPATTFCVAVGVAGTSATHWRPLVEHFGRRGFSVLPSPAPWGAQLVGVACRTAQYCLAVGSDGNNTFSERWNGEGWRVLSTPSPRLDGGDMLTKVVCTSTAACIAIGVENGGTKDARPLVEHWDGTAWSLVGSPAVPAAVLESISCPSATNCFVVGIKDTMSGLGRPLIEHWNGHEFTLSPVPSGGGQLFSVSCGGPASCVAVGNGGGGTALVVDLAGGSWHTSPHPRSSDFAATACVSPSSCYAVGGVTAHWNGQTWGLGGPVAAYGGSTGLARGAQLQALSCPAPTECIGVGELFIAVGRARAVADVVSGTPATQG